MCYDRRIERHTTRPSPCSDSLKPRSLGLHCTRWRVTVYGWGIVIPANIDSSVRMSFACRLRALDLVLRTRSNVRLVGRPRMYDVPPRHRTRGRRGTECGQECTAFRPACNYGWHARSVSLVYSHIRPHGLAYIPSHSNAPDAGRMTACYQSHGTTNNGWSLLVSPAAIVDISNTALADPLFRKRNRCRFREAGSRSVVAARTSLWPSYRFCHRRCRSWNCRCHGRSQRGKMARVVAVTGEGRERSRCCSQGPRVERSYYRMDESMRTLLSIWPKRSRTSVLYRCALHPPPIPQYLCIQKELISWRNTCSCTRLAPATRALRLYTALLIYSTWPVSDNSRCRGFHTGLSYSWKRTDTEEQEGKRKNSMYS